MSKKQPMPKLPPEFAEWYLYSEQVYISTNHNMIEGDPNTHIPLNKHERFKCKMYEKCNTLYLSSTMLAKVSEYKNKYPKYDKAPSKKEERHEIF